MEIQARVGWVTDVVEEKDDMLRRRWMIDKGARQYEMDRLVSQFIVQNKP